MAAPSAGTRDIFTGDRMRSSRPRPTWPTPSARRYPDLDVPYHSRWRHFEAGGVDRWARIGRRLAARPRRAGTRADRPRDHERAARRRRRAAMALFDEAHRHHACALGGPRVASFACSPRALSRRTPTRRCAPMRGTGARSTRIRSPRDFRCAADNPLVGLEGRAALLRRLGDVATAHTPRCSGRPARLGHLSTISAAHAREGAIERRRSCWQHCCARSGRSGRRGSRSKACRSATAGGIPRHVARLPTIPPLGTSRSTSLRSGSPIRCWSRWRTPASR